MLLKSHRKYILEAVDKGPFENIQLDVNVTMDLL